MNLQDQIVKANERGVGDFHVVKDGNITATHRGFVSTCLIALNQNAEVYNSFGDRVWPENDDAKFVIYHTGIGNNLTSASTLEELNNGSDAYPPVKARALRIGESLNSTIDKERAIRRVS